MFLFPKLFSISESLSASRPVSNAAAQRGSRYHYPFVCRYVCCENQSEMREWYATLLSIQVRVLSLSHISQTCLKNICNNLKFMALVQQLVVYSPNQV